MPLFEADPETHAIVIYSEPGGRMEAELADWVRANKSRLPIIAFMATASWTRCPAYASATPAPSSRARPTPPPTDQAHEAGISVAERIEDIPALVKQRLGRRSKGLSRPTACSSTSSRCGGRQRRGLVKKLVDVCPVNAPRRKDGALRIVGEARRVHALRPLHQARRAGAGHQLYD
jgi:hypothetical protein